MAKQSIMSRLQSGSPDVRAGEYLVAVTLSDGYTGIAYGNNLYEVQAYGDNGLQVVPVDNVDGVSFTAFSNEPVVIHDAANNKLIYVKNAREEVYHHPYPVVEDLEAGDDVSAKILLAFMEYAKDKYRIGVNNFMIADSTVLFDGVEGITLSSDSQSVTVGGTTQIDVTVDPSDADQDVIYASSDESVATVDGSGLVTGVAEGEAVITATSASNSDVSETITITVTAA